MYKHRYRVVFDLDGESMEEFVHAFDEMEAKNLIHYRYERDGHTVCTFFAEMVENDLL